MRRRFSRALSTRYPQLEIEFAVTEFSITLRYFGVVAWEYCCHTVIGGPFLNLFDKGVQFVVIVLEGGSVVGAVPFQGFSNPPRADNRH